MDRQDVVTVVSGLPRSGTSMMMQMLSVGGLPLLTDHVRGSDADNPNGYFEFEPVKSLPNDTSWLPDAVGKAVKIVCLLLYELPAEYQYRVIFMRRNLNEVIASQNRMLKRQRNETDRENDDEIKIHFKNHLNKFDLWVSRQQNIKIHYVEHRCLLTDPSTSLNKLNDFLHGILNVNTMISVVDRNLYRQRVNLKAI